MTGNSLNSYGTAAGSGQNYYCKIGTIKILGAYANYPLGLEFTGRGYGTSIVEIIFESVNGNDPNISFFTNSNTRPFYLYKSATSTWILYGKYNEAWGNLYLSRIFGAGAATLQFTVEFENVGTSTPTYTIASTNKPDYYFYYYGLSTTTKASIDGGY